MDDIKLEENPHFGYRYYNEDYAENFDEMIK